jgi:hypothetical protein
VHEAVSRANIKHASGDRLHYRIISFIIQNHASWVYLQLSRARYGDLVAK